jgi:hypothetical protein
MLRSGALKANSSAVLISGVLHRPKIEGQESPASSISLNQSIILKSKPERSENYRLEAVIE